MFTARPNVLRSAIAIALSSFLLEPVKAGENVKVKLTGTDYSKSKTYSRLMNLEFGDTSKAPVITSFPEDTATEHFATFYSSQLQSHRYQLEVVTSQSSDGTAQSYITTLKYQDTVFAQLEHELSSGALTLSVDKALKGSFAQQVKKTLKETQALPDPLTGVCPPTTFGKLLEIYSTYLQKTSPSGQMVQLQNFHIESLKLPQTPFLRQTMYNAGSDINPETMHLEKFSIFPDPEHSMSIIATTLLHKGLDTKKKASKSPYPLDLNKIVSQLQETSPLVSIVTNKQKLAQITETYANKLPVIALTGEAGDIQLTARQINAAAALWVKSATTGIHEGYDSLMVKSNDAPDLREACYQEQASVIRQAIKSGTPISPEDIAILSHYQQLISVMDFVIAQASDLTLNKSALQQIHLLGRGIYLKAHLAKKFTDVGDIKEFVHSDEFNQPLVAAGFDSFALEAQLTDGDDFKGLILHQAVKTQEAMQKLFQESTEEQLLLRERLKELGTRIDNLQEQIAEEHKITLTGETLEDKTRSLQEGMATKAGQLEETEARMTKLEQTRTQLEEILKPKTDATVTEKPPSEVDLPQAATKLLKDLSDSNQAIQSLSTQLQQKDEQYSKLKESSENIKKTLDQTRSKLSSTAADFTEATKKVEGTVSVVEAFENQFPDLKKEGTLPDRVAHLEEHVRQKLTELRTIDKADGEPREFEQKIRNLLKPIQPKPDKPPEQEAPSAAEPPVLTMVQELVTQLQTHKTGTAAGVVRTAITEGQIKVLTEEIQKAEQQRKVTYTPEEYDLVDRVKHLLTPEDYQPDVMSSLAKALEEGLEEIRKVVPGTEPGAKESGADLAKKVATLVQEHDQKKSEVETLMRQVEESEARLEEQQGDIKRVGDGSEYLTGLLKVVTEEKSVVEQTLKQADDVVKAYEDKHQKSYQPDPDDDFPTRLTKAVDHASSEITKTRVEEARLKTEVAQSKEQLDEIKQVVDVAVPDEAGQDESVAEEPTTLEKIRQLSRKKVKHEQEAVKLTERVQNLEKANTLAAEEGGADQLNVEYANVKEQLSAAENELQTTRATFDVVKKELKRWEEAHSLTAANEDDILTRTKVLSGRLETQEQDLGTVETSLKWLRESQEHVDTLVKSSVHIHPSDLAKGMPKEAEFDTLAQVTVKYDDPSDELLINLREMEKMLGDFKTNMPDNYKEICGKIKTNIKMIDVFWDVDKKEVINEAVFENFLRTVYLPEHEKEVLTRTLANVDPEKWVNLIDDVQLMQNNDLSPAQTALPHLTMAKSGLSFAELRGVFEAAEGVEKYEGLYPSLVARPWLLRVDHPIPSPDTLETFPPHHILVTITLDDFNALKIFLQRHNVQPPLFPQLVDKLQQARQWVSVSDGSSEIDQQIFVHLKSAIAGSPTGGTVDQLAEQIRASGKSAELASFISAADSFEELTRLLGDARALSEMAEAGKVIPATLNMVFDGTEPAVAKMAQVAEKGAPEHYRQRYEELHQQAIKRQAIKVLNRSAAVAILADDDSVELLDAMSDSTSQTYQTLKAVPDHLPAGNPDDIPDIHRKLTLISQLLTGDHATDDPVLKGLVDTLKEAGEFADAKGRITDPESYYRVLQANNLSSHKEAVTRIFSSGITAGTAQTYVDQAVALIELHDKIVPLCVFQAAYEQEWTAEQFRLVNDLAATPEVRSLAKEAHAVPGTSGLRGMTSQTEAMDAVDGKLMQLVKNLGDLDQEKLAHYNRLAPELEAFKTSFRIAEIQRPDQADIQYEGEIEEIIGKIQRASTFAELQTATDDFTKHPRVKAAQELAPKLKLAKELLATLPSADDLEAMENFKTGSIRDSALQWVKYAGDSELRKEKLQPHLAALAAVSEKELHIEDVADQYTQILETASEPETAADKATSTARSAVFMVRDVHKVMHSLHEHQQKPMLEPDDLPEIRNSAEELSKDSYRPHLELWTGSSDKISQTLQEHLAKLKTCADAEVKDHLDKVFEPDEIGGSLRLNAYLRESVDSLEKAKPYITTYQKVTAEYDTVQDVGFGTRSRDHFDALEDTLEAIAAILEEKKAHINPQLVENGPKPTQQAGQDNVDNAPNPSDVHKSTTRMLEQEGEIDALNKLKVMSEQVVELEGQRASLLEDGDIDVDFAGERQVAITELEGFCEECTTKKLLPPGTLDHLHEEGVIRQTSVEHATQQIKDGLKYREAASDMLQAITEEGSPRLGQEMVTHVKVLSELSDLEEEAIPKEFKEVIVLVREMHNADDSVTPVLEKMREQKQFRLDRIPQPLQESFAQQDRWQLLVEFIGGEDNIGELGQDVSLADMINTDPTSQLRLSKRVATNMAASKALDIQLEKSLKVLGELPETEEMQAAMFLKKAQVEVGFEFDSLPASPEVIKQQLQLVYGDKLPDFEATAMSRVIYRGITIQPDSWGKVQTALDKMPKSSPKIMAGAIKQIMSVDLKLAHSLLNENEPFHRWLGTDPLPKKMVTAVHNYQLKVEDIEAVRVYQKVVDDMRSNPTAFKAAKKTIPKYPKASHMLQITEKDMQRLADLPESQWQKSIIAIASDSRKKSAAFALSQSLKNSVDVSTRFILEFILDDINLYGGTGTIAVLLGYADSTLEWMGIDRDSFIRAALLAYTNDLFNPRFQQFASRWVTPFTSGFQTYRVIKDVSAYVSPADASAAAGALRSMSFFLLAELNDLTWGGELTRRMALAFRGMDQLVDVQIILEDRIRRTRNRYARGKITKAEMRLLIKQDLTNIALLAKGGDNWREDCKAVVETLRGDDGISDADIEAYINYINSSYSYQHIKKTWEEGVSTVSAILSKGRPFMTPFTSSLPKYMILSGVVDPLVRYGVNAVAPGAAGAIGKLPAALLGTSIPLGPVTLPPAVLGTIAVMTGTTLYDSAYNDLELTRKTWYPFAEFVDTYVNGIDFEKAKALGVENPVSWTGSLNSTLPWLSMSAPDNMWLAGTKKIVGEKFARTIFGHKKSAVGYAFRPFTYTYEKILDHYYEHPAQQITSVGPDVLDVLDAPAPATDRPDPASTIDISPTPGSQPISSSVVVPTPSPDASHVSEEELQKNPVKEESDFLVDF